jgi:hypothetical protein
MGMASESKSDEVVGLLRDIRDKLPGATSHTGAPQSFTSPLFTQANRTYQDWGKQ